MAKKYYRDSIEPLEAFDVFRNDSTTLSVEPGESIFESFRVLLPREYALAIGDWLREGRLSADIVERRFREAVYPSPFEGFGGSANLSDLARIIRELLAEGRMKQERQDILSDVNLSMVNSPQTLTAEQRRMIRLHQRSEEILAERFSADVAANPDMFVFAYLENGELITAKCLSDYYEKVGGRSPKNVVLLYND